MFTVTLWMDALGHSTSRLTAAPNTWKCCHWLSDCLGCSFTLWLGSLAASGLSLDQGGSPFGCRAGAEAGAGEAEGSSTCAGSAASGSQRADRRYSCSGICLIQWHLPHPVWHQEHEDSKNHVGVLSVLKPEGPWQCWDQDSVWVSGTLSVVSVSLWWLGLTTSAFCSLVHESFSPSAGSQTKEEDRALESV